MNSEQSTHLNGDLSQRRGAETNSASLEHSAAWRRSLPKNRGFRLRSFAGIRAGRWPRLDETSAALSSPKGLRGDGEGDGYTNLEARLLPFPRVSPAVDAAPKSLNKPVMESESASHASQEEPPQKGLIDSIMRGTVLILLGAVVTAPIWYESGSPTGGFAPGVFRADRQTNFEDDLAREIEAIVRGAHDPAGRTPEEARRTLMALFESQQLGDERTRRQEISRLMDEIATQAGENPTEGMAESEMQASAIENAARMKARQIIQALGGQVIATEVEEIEGDWTSADWATLTSFDYIQSGPIPDDVHALDGVNVMLAGYLVELDDTHYLLVQSLWSCCFGAPPEVNEAIVVRAPNAGRVEGRPVRVYGRFEVGEELDEGFVTSLYRLDAEHVQAL
ncbi:MAG: DUF3299 domain-containing protein [Myxococcota bacterium]